MRARTEDAAAEGGLTVEADAGDEAAPATDMRVSLDEILSGPNAPASEQETSDRGAAGFIGVRTARLLQVSGRRAIVTLRGQRAPVDLMIADEVDPEIVGDALANDDLVLVERIPGEDPVVVGVLQTRRPREIRLHAATVHIEGDQEVSLRSGRSAVRIREGGDIEITGSRISAVSRGLFRIVGKLLRLN